MRTMALKQPQIKSSPTQMISVPPNVHNNTQQPQIMSSYSQMTLIPSNVYSCTQQHQIWSIWTQRTIKPWNVHNCIQTILKSSPLTLKWPQYTQMCTFALTNRKSLKSSSYQLKWPSIYSKMHKYTWPTQTTTQMHLLFIQALQTLKGTLTTSNVHLYTYNATNMHQCTSNTKHPKSSSEH